VNITSRFIKRLIDIVGASSALILTSPLITAMFILIPKKLGKGGVFFTQTRPGFKEEPFDVVKLRTMLETFDEDGNILPEGERLPEFGWTLRRLSIDEIPQFWNVLKGEMSIVGPRPLLTEYLEAYPPEARRRHDVKPGITGWAQVNGRHESTFSQRLAQDVYYVDNQSLGLDFKIMWYTVTRVLLKSNVRKPSQDIAEIDDLDLHRFVTKRKKDDS
jgi:lipopolysaccharide/colanic/teichoic acid biosynthesis glycosyltransferase